MSNQNLDSEVKEEDLSTIGGNTKGKPKSETKIITSLINNFNKMLKKANDYALKNKLSFSFVTRKFNDSIKLFCKANDITMNELKNIYLLKDTSFMNKHICLIAKGDKPGIETIDPKRQAKFCHLTHYKSGDKWLYIYNMRFIKGSTSLYDLLKSLDFILHSVKIENIRISNLKKTPYKKFVKSVSSSLFKSDKNELLKTCDLFLNVVWGT